MIWLESWRARGSSSMLACSQLSLAHFTYGATIFVVVPRTESWRGTSLGEKTARTSKIAKVWQDLFYVDSRDKTDKQFKFVALGM